MSEYVHNDVEIEIEGHIGMAPTERLLQSLLSVLHLFSPNNLKNIVKERKHRTTSVT
jgi:hypothetical protein